MSTPIWRRAGVLPDTGVPTTQNQTSSSSSSTSSPGQKPKEVPAPVWKNLPKPDVFVPGTEEANHEEVEPKPKPKPRKTYNPFKGYEKYYEGLYAEDALLGTGRYVQEKSQLEQWLNPNLAGIWYYRRTDPYPENATLTAWHPSLKEKIENDLREIYDKSIFGLLSHRLQLAEKETLAEYALTGNTKRLVALSFATGLYRPIMNPPKFFYDIARTPIFVANLLGDAVKKLFHRGEKKSQTQDLLTQRLEHGAKIMAISELVGSMLSGSALMPSVDYQLARVRGYWRTRGLPKVEPEKVIDKSVLEGRAEFAYYPKSVFRKGQLEKIEYLYKVNKQPKQVLSQATGAVDDTTPFLGLHATSTEFPEVTEVLPGSSEAPGLYMAPITSPHFLRIQEPTEMGGYSLSLRNFFGKPLFMLKPTILAVETRGIRRIPWSLHKKFPIKLGDKLFTDFMWSRAGKGETYISWRSAIGYKPEMEVIATPGSALVRVSKGAYTVYKGIRVPIRVYKLLPKEAVSQAVRSMPKTRVSGYSSLGLESTPYGTYMLLSGLPIASVYMKNSALSESTAKAQLEEETPNYYNRKYIPHEVLEETYSKAHPPSYTLSGYEGSSLLESSGYSDYMNEPSKYIPPHSSYTSGGSSSKTSSDNSKTSSSGGGYHPSDFPRITPSRTSYTPSTSSPTTTSSSKTTSSTYKPSPSPYKSLVSEVSFMPSEVRYTTSEPKRYSSQRKKKKKSRKPKVKKAKVAWLRPVAYWNLLEGWGSFLNYP